MAHITEDRVLETSTTTGTGALTLAGAVTGFRAFGSVMTSPSDTCWYSLWAVDSNGNATGDFEEGLGTYSGANTLTRTTVLRSSNANAVVTLAAGTKYVALSLLAPRTVQLDNNLAMLLPGASAEPGTPAAGFLYLYAREIVSGHMVMRVKRPSGVDNTIQDYGLAFNRVMKWGPSAATIVAVGGGAPTTTGATLGTVSIASGSAKSNAPRVQLASGAAAGNVAPWAFAANIAQVYRGALAGEGGFRMVWRFALNQQQTGNRGFWGLSDATAVATNIDPTTSTTNGKVGVGMNSNTGNWQLIYNVAASAPTVTDLGANFPIDTTSVIELMLFCRPYTTSAGSIAYRVRRFTTNSDAPAFETSGTLSSNLPTAATILQPWAFHTNNAQAAAVQWHHVSLTLENDW